MTELVPALRVESRSDGYIIHFAQELNHCRSFVCLVTITGKLTCPLCGSRYISIDAMILHLNKPHTRCEFCDKSFVVIKKHIDRMHLNGNTTLNNAAHKFVENQVAAGHSLYEIDRAIGRAFGYFVS